MGAGFGSGCSGFRVQVSVLRVGRRARPASHGVRLQAGSMAGEFLGDPDELRVWGLGLSDVNVRVLRPLYTQLAKPFMSRAGYVSLCVVFFCFSQLARVFDGHFFAFSFLPACISSCVDAPLFREVAEGFS